MITIYLPTYIDYSIHKLYYDLRYINLYITVSLHIYYIMDYILQEYISIKIIVYHNGISTNKHRC